MGRRAVQSWREGCLLLGSLGDMGHAPPRGTQWARQRFEAWGGVSFISTTYQPPQPPPTITDGHSLCFNWLVLTCSTWLTIYAWRRCLATQSDNHTAGYMISKFANGSPSLITWLTHIKWLICFHGSMGRFFPEGFSSKHNYISLAIPTAKHGL